LYNRINYSVHRSVDEENRYYVRLTGSVGLSYTAPDIGRSIYCCQSSEGFRGR